MGFSALSWDVGQPRFAVVAEASSKTRSAGASAPSFEELFERYAADVHRLVCRLLGPGADRADIEDLGQQIFMALHLALPKYRGDSKISTWVYGIASRVVYRELRNRTRHRRMVQRLERKVVHTPSDARPPQEAQLELAEVWRCLMRIHPKKRVVFVLHEIEGLSGKEISQALQIKEPTVHSRLFYARRELMRALEAKR